VRARLLAAVLLAGCGRPPEPEPPPDPPAPEIPAIPEIETAGAGEIDLDAHPVLPPAGGAAALAWDFSERAHHVYGYLQESHLVLTSDARGEKTTRVTMRSRHEGIAEFVGGGGGRGVLRFKSTPREQRVNDHPMTGEELNQIKPVLFECLLGEDGVFTSWKKISGETDYPLLDLLFALPGKPLAPGDRDSREVHVARGQNDFQYHGKLTISHAGRRKVGRSECVKLLSEVEIELTPPAEGRGRMRGRIAGYFDPEARRFARVEAAFSLAAHTRALLRPKDPKIAPFWNLGGMRSDTRITLELKD
jgi:hypothetical protein